MAALIVVVDYHKGNLLSVARGLGDVGAEAIVTDDPLVDHLHALALESVHQIDQ